MARAFHRLVQRDLREVLEYYEDAGGIALADRFFDEASALVAMIEQAPARFHPVAHGLRRANLPNFPYHFLFRETKDVVRIYVLRHHRRHPAYGLTRR